MLCSSFIFIVVRLYIPTNQDQKLGEKCQQYSISRVSCQSCYFSFAPVHTYDLYFHRYWIEIRRGK